MVSMVTEGREMAAFRLRICSSTEVSLERGLEGMLADLRWHAILGIGESFETLKLLRVGEKKDQRQAAAMLSSGLQLRCLYSGGGGCNYS
jgi:hypothetical protein